MGLPRLIGVLEWLPMEDAPNLASCARFLQDVRIGAGRTSSLIKESLDDLSLAQPSYVPCPRLLAVVSFFNVYGDFAALSFGSLERKSVLTPFHLQLDSFSAVAGPLKQSKLSPKIPFLPGLLKQSKLHLKYFFFQFQATNECSEHPAFVRSNGEGSEVAENGVLKSADGSDNVCSRATG
ncbi:hypothetical protein NC651_013712 [Populus alba x Populus x berolinensis]|nr:hypothetical protein NC651_013712 [Populus alba x Populus x berolinensis]